MADGKKSKIPSSPTWLSRVIRLMNAAGTIWIFVLLVIINMDICGRFLLSAPLRGVPEIVSLSILACVFLQLAHSVGEGRLTRSEVFLLWVAGKSTRLFNLMEAVFHFTGGILMLVLFFTSVPLFEKAWKINEYVGAEGDFMLPVWPVKLIMLVGAFAAAVQFFVLAYLYATGCFSEEYGDGHG